MRSIECSRARPFSPITAVTVPSRAAGIWGDAVLTNARAWSGACTASSGVENAEETAAAVPVTGNRMLPAAGVPTLRPSACSAEDTWATSDGDGPNSAANRADVR